MYGRSVAFASGNLCPAGHYCPANVGAPIRCAPGSFQDTPGQAACQDCPAGVYCPRHNMTLPAALLPPCAAGYWCKARSVVANPVSNASRTKHTQTLLTFTHIFMLYTTQLNPIKYPPINLKLTKIILIHTNMYPTIKHTHAPYLKLPNPYPYPYPNLTLPVNPSPQRCAVVRPPRHRQDAAGQGRGHRERLRILLHHVLQVRPIYSPYLISYITLI